MSLLTFDGHAKWLETKTFVKHWGGKLPHWERAMIVWIEVGVATVNSKTHSKLKNKGITGMFVGYAVDHSNGVYHMKNSNTGQLLISRDVTWLKRMSTINNQPFQKSGLGLKMNWPVKLRRVMV